VLGVVAVEVRDEGRQRLYRVNGHALKPIHDWGENYERSWSARSISWTCVGGTQAKEEKMTVTTSGRDGDASHDEQILITRQFDVPRPV